MCTDITAVFHSTRDVCDQTGLTFEMNTSVPNSRLHYSRPLSVAVPVQSFLGAALMGRALLVTFLTSPNTLFFDGGINALQLLRWQRNGEVYRRAEMLPILETGLRC